MKNCDERKSGRKDFLDHWLAEKEGALFRQKVVAKNVRERNNKGKEKEEGLIAKLNANNFCQRKLF